MSGLKRLIHSLFSFGLGLILLGGSIAPAAGADMPQTGLSDEQRSKIQFTSNFLGSITKTYFPLMNRGELAPCVEITTDTNWSLEGSPYLISCDVYVASGVTLTINAGVAVQFEHTGDDLIVSGRLQSVGTEQAPIIFQPWSGTTPGIWGSVVFWPGSSGVLDHTHLEYGGSSKGMIYIASDAVQVINSVVQYSADTGIYIHASSPMISATQILSNTSSSGGGLYNDSGSPTIQGNTFSGNYIRFNFYSSNGGGMYNGSGNPIIRNNTFRGNYGCNGSGLFNGSGSPIVQDNTFNVNTSGSIDEIPNCSDGHGGGVYNDSGSPLVMNNEFTSNESYGYNDKIPGGYGGGFFNGSGSPFIKDNTFIQNSALGVGGGLSNFYGSPNIESNLFISNTVRGTWVNGGGLSNYEGNPLIQNNIFVGNMAQGTGGSYGGAGGGGVSNLSGNPTIQNNTFRANLAESDNISYGGGLYIEIGDLIIQNNTFIGNAAASGGGLYTRSGDEQIIRSNIVVSNTANTGGGIYNDSGYLVLDFNDVWDNSSGDYFGIDPGIHDIDADPQLVDPANGDFHLAPDSPCIDAGDPDNYPSADFEGDLRPMGMAPDIGADEAHALRVSITSIPDGASPGAPVLYYVSLSNSMSITLTNVRLTDTLPVETTFIGYQSDRLSCVHDGSAWGGQLRCNLDNLFLAPGESQTLTITVKLAESLALFQYVTNPITATAYTAGENRVAFNRALTLVTWCAVQLNDTPMGSNIQAAIEVSSHDSDVVKVTNYCVVNNLNINKTLTLQGGWNQNFTVRDPTVFTTTLDGQSLDRVIQVEGYVNPTIEGFIITGGRVNGSGGGILTWFSSPTIKNNTFKNNYANRGGGLANEFGNPIIQNNTFTDNSADGGGGLFNDSGNPIIQNNTFVGNYADEGGGLSLYGGKSNLRSNIVVNNAANYVGGIYSYMTFIVFLDYNDAWNNTGGNYYNVTPGAHDISVDPLLVDPANGDFHLASDSPCIDAGDPLNYPSTDFEGDPRPYGPAPDIGADEFHP